MIKNVSKENLEDKGFKLVSYYGECPVYEKDDVVFIFKEKDNDLTQIVKGHIKNKHMSYHPSLYLSERINKMQKLIPLAFDYLPHNYDRLNQFERDTAYALALFRLTNDKLDSLIHYAKSVDDLMALYEIKGEEDDKK